MKEYTVMDLYNYLEYDPELQLRYLLNTINDNVSLDKVPLRDSLSGVLSVSFQWSRTPEGGDYWVNLNRKLYKEIHN
jgi:hypothetical protein